MAPGLPRIKSRDSARDGLNIGRDSGRNSSLNSSALIRCLIDRAIVNAADVAQMAAETDVKQSFAEELGLWLDWTDAIALSAALGTGAALQAPGIQLGTPSPATTVIAEFKRVRADLAQAIRADVGFETEAPDQSAADFSPYRRSYRAHQQAMETRIGVLRAQVRAVLSGLSAELKRIAALDAVLDKALAAKERHLLSTVPSLLEKHFKRLGAGGGATPEACLGPSQSPVWLAVFFGDMQAALLAELDFRLHAVDGMVDAMPTLPTRQS